MINQRTIAKETSFTGLGLHTGKKITLTLKPGVENFGIKFRRADLKSGPLIHASADTVSATENNTTIGSNPYTIHTVEHLLSAIYGLGINNILIEVDGPEIPIMDGSGTSFVFLLKETGIISQNSPKTILVVKKEVKVKVGDNWAMISPNRSLVIDSTIDFAHPLIKRQHKVFKFSCEAFIKEISRARTFGLLRDVDYLKRKGLIKGGSLDNAIVLDDFKVMNPDGLRFEDEFVRHKILDTIGDLALLGYEIAGKITTFKSGHKLHNLLCRELLKDKNAYELVPATQLEEEYIKPYALPTLVGQSVY
ncbi:MAG: UDP-3-O-[3-hydroxymyristoyl] N-acetylglucosamine deacetylase [Epsilonproteobacteria bacterium]|nr:MAG: UDP-3-O-[3-hydroxymyristoyl] N-acetylglucosamine deacetylase [Campylobacterota bacterium]